MKIKLFFIKSYPRCKVYVNSLFYKNVCLNFSWLLIIFSLLFALCHTFQSTIKVNSSVILKIISNVFSWKFIKAKSKVNLIDCRFKLNLCRTDLVY